MIKHYFCFRNYIEENMDKVNEENWDKLRTAKAESPFSIEKTCIKWEKNCQHSEKHRMVAKDIIKNSGSKKFISFGCGKAILEYNLLNSGDNNISVTCTDYTQKTVSILNKYFGEKAEVFQFNMKEDDYCLLGEYDTAILFRVSTEFCMEDWMQILDSLYNSKINKIVFVPTEVLNLRIAIKERLHNLYDIVKGGKLTFCGYMYTKKEFYKMFGLWKVSRITSCCNFDIFYLEK